MLIPISDRMDLTFKIKVEEEILESKNYFLQSSTIEEEHLIG